MNKQFIDRITSLRLKEKKARESWVEVREELSKLMSVCDHRDEKNRTSIRIESHPYQRICNICGAAVMGRNNVSVHNPEAQKILEKRQKA